MHSFVKNSSTILFQFNLGGRKTKKEEKKDNRKPPTRPLHLFPVGFFVGRGGEEWGGRVKSSWEGWEGLRYISHLAFGIFLQIIFLRGRTEGGGCKYFVKCCGQITRCNVLKSWDFQMFWSKSRGESAWLGSYLMGHSAPVPKREREGLSIPG